MTRAMRTWIPIVAALALLGACSDSASGGSATTTEAATSSAFEAVELPPTPKPDFTLVDTDGQEFDFRAETDGSITLLFFGYTNCPDICSPHLAQIAQVLDMPSAPTNVKVVFVTVDPERDTPEVLRAFLDRFDRSFIGLTGDPADIQAAQQAAGVAVAIVEEPDEDGDYLIGHSGEMRGYAPNGLNYVTFPYGTRQSQFAHDLEVLDRLRSPDDQP